ncbi:hypothetical protein [Limnobacter sp.]|uniref:hypothetical protein n=1 Tax=Limnobacter sp. TaxID=2003368 RepID=UPI0025BA6D32|nr:hypothetical protein [Limnobacter sp.]
MGIKRDPAAIADIRTRREAGETLASIGETYGVTREYIRQVCVAHNIKDKSPSILELTEKAIDLLKTGKATSVPQAAQLLGISSGTRLWIAAKNHNLDLSSALEYAIAHKHDGKRFGMWEVIPGSYRRIMKEDTSKTIPLVDCRCDCGTERTVMWHNLINHYSRGCGCRVKTGDRKQTPWLCLETNEREPYTQALANRFDINGLQLVRRKNLGQNWIAPDGTTWKPLLEESHAFISPRKSRPWVCLDTGEVFESAQSLSRRLGVCNTGMYTCIKKGRTYCAWDRRHYVPVGMEDLPRSEFYIRRGNQIPKKARNAS